MDACYKIKLLLKLLHTIYIFKNKWYLKHNSFEVLCKIWEKIQFLRRAFPLTIFCVLLRQASFFCLFIITLKFMFDQFFSFSAFRLSFEVIILDGWHHFYLYIPEVLRTFNKYSSTLTENFKVIVLKAPFIFKM